MACDGSHIPFRPDRMAASTATTRAGIACCVLPSLTPTTASLMPMWGRLGAQATIRYSPTLGCYSRSRPTQRSGWGWGRAALLPQMAALVIGRSNTAKKKL
eukprot:scaffold34735_cov183-Isochrysis_galbana.AAC.1